MVQKMSIWLVFLIAYGRFVQLFGRESMFRGDETCIFECMLFGSSFLAYLTGDRSPLIRAAREGLQKQDVGYEIRSCVYINIYTSRRTYTVHVLNSYWPLRRLQVRLRGT